jgi:hypothetical protein
MLKLGVFLASLAAVSTVEASTTAAVSYNLYWWWVSSNGQFGNLFNVINNQQYDIIGYSECDDMQYVVENTCGSGCDFYNPQGAAMVCRIWRGERETDRDREKSRTWCAEGNSTSLFPVPLSVRWGGREGGGGGQGQKQRQRKNETGQERTSLFFPLSPSCTVSCFHRITLRPWRGVIRSTLA